MDLAALASPSSSLSHAHTSPAALASPSSSLSHAHTSLADDSTSDQMNLAVLASPSSSLSHAHTSPAVDLVHPGVLTPDQVNSAAQAGLSSNLRTSGIILVVTFSSLIYIKILCAIKFLSFARYSLLPASPEPYLQRYNIIGDEAGDGRSNLGEDRRVRWFQGRMASVCREAEFLFHRQQHHGCRQETCCFSVSCWCDNVQSPARSVIS